MHDAKSWRRTHRALTITQVVSIFGIVAFSASQNIDTEWVARQASVLKEPVEFLQLWNRALSPLLAGLIILCQWLKKIVGPPRIWQALTDVLTTFRDVVYPDKDDDDVHQNRITLFKYKRVCLRARCFWKVWGGWLVPVVRTGHTTLTGPTIFRAPDRPEQARIKRGKPRGAKDVQQGVAGMAWNREKVYMVANLPAVANEPGDPDLAEYAERTGVSIDWLRRTKPLARSYCGIPIEVGGRRWGVVVLDSHNPEGIRETGQMQRKYELLGRIVRTLC